MSSGTLDVVIRGGSIHDGSGEDPWVGDIALSGERIVAIEPAVWQRGETEIDAAGMAVAPGFINMMSWSPESLIADGRSQSEIRQGVTLEVMGEGLSMGPLTEEMKGHLLERGILGAGTRVSYDIGWTSLCGYLSWLEQKGVSPNVASFVGAGTLRVHEVGFEDRPATDDELARMCDLLEAEMRQGALGVASSLIYPPSSYAPTDELVALARTAARSGGMYASHMRSEGQGFIEALEELISIAVRAEVRAEVYHLKAGGRDNWSKMDQAIDMIEAARAEGIPITADMYPYEYAGTFLTACIPPWAHEGGFEALLARLSDEVMRARIGEAMRTPTNEWENMFVETGPDGILLAGLRDPALAELQGRTLAGVATARAVPPEVALMDLIVEDRSNVFAMFFSMSEDNLRKQIVKPWVSFCSDAESQAPEGVFLQANPHPRAYGAFARVLGRYVRDESLIALPEAVRRLTSLPATNLGLTDRGLLRRGAVADVVVFDPERVEDHATPADPHRYATGMGEVFVNGTPVLRDGEHTGATPGRFVRGQGWRSTRTE